MLANKQISGIKNESEELRQFGMTTGLSFLLIGTIFFILGRFGAWYFLTLSLCILASALFFPKALKLLYIMWSILIKFLGWIINRFFLAVLFYLIFVPAGFGLKLAGKKLLDLDFKTKRKKSYWIEKEVHLSGRNNEKQY